MWCTEWRNSRQKNEGTDGVNGERSDEMMKPSIKQEDATRRDRKRRNTLRLKWEN